MKAFLIGLFAMGLVSFSVAAEDAPPIPFGIMPEAITDWSPQRVFADNAAPGTFDPRFLEMLQDVHVIHFAHLLKTAKAPPHSWQERVRPGESQAGDKGMAFEHAVDLCNRLGTDGWFNVPHWADDHYVRRMAELVRDRMDSNLRVSVEYAYDVGFYITQPAKYCREQGLALKLSQNPKEAGARFYALRAAEVFSIWQDVFDHSERLRCVLARVDGKEDYQWADVWQRADCYAFVNTLPGLPGGLDTAAETAALSVDEFLDRVAATAAEPVSSVDLALIADVKKHGLVPVSFYMIPALFADPRIDDPQVFQKLVKLTEKANRHPRIEEIFLTHIAKWHDAGIVSAVYPHLVAKATKWGNWGLLESMEQATSPKWRAVRRCLAAAPSHESLPVLEAPDIALEDDETEKRRDPVMGRVSSHLGAAMTINGFHEDANVRFDQRYTLPPQSVFWAPLYLKGQAKRDYFRFFGMKTPEHEWRHVTLELIPENDGWLELSLEAAASQRFQGIGYSDGSTWPAVAHYDHFRVAGATLENPDFETMTNGAPVGWTCKTWAASVRPRIETEGSNQYARVITKSPYIGRLDDLKKDQPVKLEFDVRSESIEKRFNLRIGFNGITENSRVKMDMQEIPMKAVCWRIDPWYHNWGDPDRLRDTEYRLALLAAVPPQWTEQVIRFVPDADGEIELTLHGTRIPDEQLGVLRPRFVDYADMQVEGATLTEWSRVGKDERAPVWHTGSDGQKFARLWYQAGLRARLTGLKAGLPVTLLFRARAHPTIHPDK